MSVAVLYTILHEGDFNNSQGLRVLPGRAGGFSLVAAWDSHVVWWNNVTRSIYDTDVGILEQDPNTMAGKLLVTWFLLSDKHDDVTLTNIILK